MRKYHAHTGRNCLQCCIAGLFDMSLEAVPTVDDWDVEGGWFNNFYEWSKKELGCIPVAVTDDTLDDLLHIEVYETAAGPSHAIISKGTEVIHNPAPEIEAPHNRVAEYRILFVPLHITPQQRVPEIDFQN